VTSRDQIESLVTRPATPCPSHWMIGLGHKNKRGLKMIWYLPRTRTLCSIYITISKCDQGIKFCSKIQSAHNRFKPDESIGLVIANPMQLVSSQTDIGSKILQSVRKVKQAKKGTLTVYSPYRLTWQGVRPYADVAEVMWMTVG
jgi:hypothetical protein